MAAVSGPRVLLLILGCVVLAWLLISPENGPDRAGRTAQHATSGGAEVEPSAPDPDLAAAPQRDAPPPAPPPSAPSVAPAESAPADHDAVRRFKENTRYPPSTRRITANSFDLLNPNARHERRQPVPDQENNADLAWHVRFTADRYFVRDDEPTLITLALWHEGTPVLPNDVAMIAEPDAGMEGDVGSVPLAVTPVGSEVATTFVPNDYWPALVGPVRVSVLFSAPGLGEQTGFLSFYFTGEDRIPARFTGDFADAERHGDLVVDVGVAVDKPGRYRIEANLFDAGGDPFGWARFEGDLLPGPQSVPLDFYGLLFHDVAASAPFVVKQVRGYRMRPGDFPNREDIPTFPGEYRTSTNYQLADFRTEENDSPRKRRMLELYRQAIERGVHLTVPEYAGTEN